MTVATNPRQKQQPKQLHQHPNPHSTKQKTKPKPSNTSASKPASSAPCTPTSTTPSVLTNVWDAGTATLAAAHPHCTALATASYAIAESSTVPSGLPANANADDYLSLDQNLAAVKPIAAVAKRYGKPLTVDFQAGYGDRLEEGVEGLIALGAVGCNIEDDPGPAAAAASSSSGGGGDDGDDSSRSLYPIREAAERVSRVKAEAARLGVPEFVVNARTDVLVRGGSVEEAIERGRAYLDAGATTVFVWGGKKRGGVKKSEVVRITKALGVGKISVKLCLGGGGWLTIRELAEMGVARISCGPELWWKAMEAFEREMNRIYERGE